jgi:hypothetical protein
MVKTSNKVILGSIMIQFYIFRTLKIYFELKKLRVLVKIKHEQNDIIAYHCRHYELGVWDKT